MDAFIKPFSYTIFDTYINTLWVNKVVKCQENVAQNMQMMALFVQ